MIAKFVGCVNSTMPLKNRHQKAPRLCSGAGILAIGRGQDNLLFLLQGDHYSELQGVFSKNQKKPLNIPAFFGILPAKGALL